MKQKEKAKLNLKIINRKLSLVYELGDKIDTLLSWEKEEDFKSFLKELEELLVKEKTKLEEKNE